MPISLLNLGGIGGKLINFGSKVTSGAKSFFGGIHKTFVRGKKGIKKGIEFFKEVGRLVKGPLNNFYKLLEAFGFLDPLLKLFAAIISIISASGLQEMLPVIMELFAYISDPEVRELLSAIGYLLAHVFIIQLRILLSVLNYLKDSGVISWLASVLRAIPPALYIAIDAIIYGFSELFKSFHDFAKELNKLSDQMSNLSFAGSGSNKKKSGGGSWVSQAASAIGFQHGTDYIGMTGYYKLHRGEGVKTAAENSAGNSQMDRMIELQERNNDLQERMFKYMRYGA